jgi:hypothetical protein
MLLARHGGHAKHLPAGWLLSWLGVMNYVMAKFWGINDDDGSMGSFEASKLLPTQMQCYNRATTHMRKSFTVKIYNNGIVQTYVHKTPKLIRRTNALQYHMHIRPDRHVSQSSPSWSSHILLALPIVCPPGIPLFFQLQLMMHLMASTHTCTS